MWVLTVGASVHLDPHANLPTWVPFQGHKADEAGSLRVQEPVKHHAVCIRVPCEGLWGERGPGETRGAVSLLHKPRLQEQPWKSTVFQRKYSMSQTVQMKSGSGENSVCVLYFFRNTVHYSLRNILPQII